MRLLHTLPLWLLLPFCAAATNTFANGSLLPISPISNFPNFPNFPFTEEDKQTFIDTYADLAIQEMNRSSIPASITLAQAILESDWGRSRISLEGNNFFCIKCTNWEGDTLRAPDDEIGLSCFRVYSDSYESFLDHTDFLMQNPRYQPLFSLNPMNYEAWAYGLKDCGYATDEEYGNKLVKIIQDYGLYVYDYSMPMTGFKILDTPEELDEKDEWETQPGEPSNFDEHATLDESEHYAEQVQEVEVMDAPGYRINGSIQRPTASIRQVEIPKMEPSEASPTGKIRPIFPSPMANLERK